MAQVNVELKVGTESFSKTVEYTTSIRREYEVDNSDTFATIFTSADGLGVNSLQSTKDICIYNKSNVGVELLLTTQDFKDNSNIDEDNSVDVSGAGASNERFTSQLLAAGDFIKLPNGRFIGYSTANSAANAANLNNAVPESVMYVDSTADTDNTTATDNVVGDIDDTTVYLEPYTSAANCTANLFYVGDLIRIRDEIMEVTAIGDKSDLANNKLTVIRGVAGSTATTDIGDDAAVRLAFFNAYQSFNKYSVAQTNKDGKFKAMNFFGFGRRLILETQGIVAGSVAIKFYDKAYQEWGLSGVTANTNTGLSASTTYYFKVAIDGGSAFEVAFTTDASNTNFGGKNGVLSKIQSIFNTQYYTEGNLYEKTVSIGIVDGDVRITSESRLATSAVAITVGTSGGSNTTNLFDGSNPIARIPASVKSAIAARLPEDTLPSKVSNISKPNSQVFMHDDMNGNLSGVGTGTINYTTGEIDFTSYPNAQFVVSANYHSAHSGGANHTANAVNQLKTIKARSVNSKINAVVQVIAHGE